MVWTVSELPGLEQPGGDEDEIAQSSKERRDFRE